MGKVPFNFEGMFFAEGNVWSRRLKHMGSCKNELEVHSDIEPQQSKKAN